MGLQHFTAEAYIDDFSLITIVLNKHFSSIPPIRLHLPNGKTCPVTIEKQENYHQQCIYKCKTPFSLDVSQEYWVDVCGCKIPVKLGSVVRTDQFDENFFEDGHLGAIYTPEFTVFKVWSPVAKEIWLRYKRFEEESIKEVQMVRSNKGLWTYTLNGDQHLTEYLFKAKVNHEWIEAADPYTRSVTINGEKSVVINLRVTDPENWNRSEKKINLRSKMESIIYEVHIRDFTIHADCGVMHKGKYLGLTEKNTKTSQGNITGLDYLTSLGVSHIQLMPVADFGSVDETKADEQYNWGYDPVHFFAPEGSYATNPFDPVCRVKELKMLIQSLQKNGLSVILDVVFNHVYKLEESSFEKLVPGYYFRYDGAGKPVNGTGVGNDTASERKMVRKFIVDALVYWMTEYKVDGFRFDLMGIHDVDTMNIVAKKLKTLNPGIFLLGEGWDLNTNLEPEKKATIASAKRLPDYSFFNDSFRDSVKGSIFPYGRMGFIDGSFDHSVMNQIIRSKKGFSGERETFLSPEQSVNYSECHDNHTLYDLLSIRHTGENEEIRRKRQLLALAFTLFARGIPFVHAGQEIFRTKYGVENSYNSPDKINALNWHEYKRYEKEVEYFRELVKIRIEQPIFREGSVTCFQRTNLSNGLLGVEFVLPITDKKEKESCWGKVLLLFNQTLKTGTIPLHNEKWNIAIKDEKRSVSEITSEPYEIKPLCFSLLYQS